MNKNEDGTLYFSAATWVTLISAIASGVAANLILIYSMAAGLQDRMDTLDARWQSRMAAISERLESKVNNVAAQIPPDWFREMVEENRRSIGKLDDRVDSLSAEVRSKQ